MKVRFLNLVHQRKSLKKPANDFVSEFILRQLEIKRNNILELFWDGNNRDRKEILQVG